MGEVERGEVERSTIVIGVDGSPEAAEALAWAERFAAPGDALTALRAWETPYVPLPTTAVPDPHDLAHECERHVEQELAQMVAARRDPRLTPIVRESRPGPAIVAEASEADLVVVGHRGTGQMSMMLGSTANYVLHHATTPVVVVRGAARELTRRVVVGVDGHDLTDGTENASVRALRWAYAVPGLAELEVIHAWSLQPVMWEFVGMEVDDYLADLDAAAAEVIDRVIDAAGEPPLGVEVVRRVVRDASSRALIQASTNADLVVVGSRGRGGFAGLLLGSTSADAAAYCHAPVAVIR